MVDRDRRPRGRRQVTVARAVARELGFAYLDSGAMYRCVALAGARRTEQAPPAELARAARIDSASACCSTAGT